MQKPKSLNSLTKKPTLKQTMKMAEEYWTKFGKLTLFPDKSSYMAYVKGIYDKINKMTIEEYKKYVGMNTQYHVDKLTKLEESTKKRLQNKG